MQERAEVQEQRPDQPQQLRQLRQGLPRPVQRHHQMLQGQMLLHLYSRFDETRQPMQELAPGSLLTDPTGCASCNHRCPLPCNISGFAACQNVACAFFCHHVSDCCKLGFADCDRDLKSNGCQTKIVAVTDRYRCGKACPLLRSNTKAPSVGSFILNSLDEEKPHPISSRVILNCKIIGPFRLQLDCN